MPKRFASIWFRHLLTDQKAIRQPELKGKAYVFAEPDHGRMFITALTNEARNYGITEGMTVADARVITPDLLVFDSVPGRNLKLLTGLAEWCLRYTPAVQLDPPDGLLLDITGCTHLKGGEKAYLREIVSRLKAAGYDVRPAIADTIGAAWGMARCATSGLIVPEDAHRNALMPLPPYALRLPTDLLVKLRNLGLHQISSFIYMPDAVLRRRFGKNMVLRLHQALGQEAEYLFPLKEPVPYTESLACLEPVTTRTAIEIGLNDLLEKLCKRLYGEGLGLRSAMLTWYRIDGKNGNIKIGTNHPSNRVQHLFKLFFNKLDTVAPGMGIELFVLDALKTEPVSDKQSEIWSSKGGADSEEVAELLDRVAGRIGNANINRYLPGEHYWPERTLKPDIDIKKKAESEWRTDKPRPMQILDRPEPIEAMALTPDYPPKLFIWKGERHVIVGADGPERIEREWWLEPGEHRDYYIAEDEAGRRYWLFRSGHYNAENNQHWYLHGFFA
ncbi:DNA polymerase Y family protein [Mucilaginibacter sp. PAMB04274]|uniref:Y-family DNA polymerase n=1 Tax=Mucilaginibacter sp. PAMB04274 TaxID=3138568 RepID=UPI0031F6F8D7